ncbi:MAG: Maf family protein [Burkholderiales bacterium]
MPVSAGAPVTGLGGFVSILEQRIYLASRSPRRRELLKQIGVAFELLLVRGDPARGADVNEAMLPDEPPRDYVKRMASLKAETGWVQVARRRMREYPVLAGDTVIALDNAVVGKPGSRENAVEILQKLSGKTHEVLSAVSLCRDQTIEVSLSVTEVEFRELHEAEIKRYIASGEGLDKAGAYAIQGKAAAFIAAISGSYSGVMGLPLFETAQLLRKFHIPVA